MQLNAFSITGTIAMTLSVTLSMIGFPRQIIRNYRLKSIEGLDSGLMRIVFVAYLGWVVYGLAKPDWFLVISQSLGVITTAVILAQIGIYRRKK